MTMNQRQFSFARFPALLNDTLENSVEHDFGRVITVKVNLHSASDDSQLFQFYVTEFY